MLVSVAMGGSCAPGFGQMQGVRDLALEAALTDSAQAGGPGPWAVSAAAQGLRCALRRTRKLHMQLLHMQDEAELLMRMRTQLSTALVSSAGRGGAVAAGMQKDDDGVDGAGAQLPQGLSLIHIRLLRRIQRFITEVATCSTKITSNVQ